MQDLLGNLWKPLGDTGSLAANLFASAALVAAWGYFMYQGVVDPAGGINSLWPIFGIANQLLAVIAFCLGTTVLLKMGRRQYAWVTLVPLVFLTAVTYSAGLMKIFSPDPRLGFLSGAAHAGVSTAAAANARLDALVTGAFLVLVFMIVAGSVRTWLELVRGTRPAALQETPFVPLPEMN